MCGRYALKQNLAEICAAFGLTAAFDAFQPRYNAAPEAILPIIVRDRLGEARWGWPAPEGVRSIINIRSETAAEKPLFARDWHAARRCLVPASGFYEWDGAGQPFFVQSPDAPLIGLCGLWTRDSDASVHFAILTRNALARLAPIHPRMPLVAVPATAHAWLDQGITPQPPRLDIYPVGPAVNITTNDNPGLLDRLMAAPQGNLFVGT